MEAGSGLPVKDRHELIGVSPVQGHKDEEGTEAAFTQREAERAEIVQPGEDSGNSL